MWHGGRRQDLELYRIGSGSHLCRDWLRGLGELTQLPEAPVSLPVIWPQHHLFKGEDELTRSIRLPCNRHFIKGSDFYDDDGSVGTPPFHRWRN